MTVAQVGRDWYSVTINVSGITEGDRQTFIWVPFLNDWYTLKEAQDYGFVYDYYVADITANNGRITIEISDEYLNYKVVAIYVKNGINLGTQDEIVYSQSPVLKAVLDFQYENEFPKVPGKDIDITVFDMKEINLFGSYIDSWINDGDGTYYPLDGVSKGDDIYCEYLTLPAQNIWNAAYSAYNGGLLSSDNYSTIKTYTFDIKDNCVEGADFKAQFFNGILYAIIKFNLTVST